MELHTQFLNAVERFFPEESFRQKSNDETISVLLENPQFKEFLAHSPSVVGIFNNATMGYEFLSDNIKEVFGYEKDVFTIPGGVKNVLETFTDEHAIIYNKYVFPTLYEYFQKCSKTKDVTKYRFTSSFQLKRKDGELIWCLQQIKVIAVDENGYALLLLIFISDITDIKKDEDIDFVVACKDEENKFRNAHVITIPPNNMVIDFSKRELEILTCIKKGLSSKEIADTLNISDNTVHNHRKNILRKADGKNIMEIIQLMSSKKII